jgi:ankyrin repeat protein
MVGWVAGAGAQDEIDQLSCGPDCSRSDHRSLQQRRSRDTWCRDADRISSATPSTRPTPQRTASTPPPKPNAKKQAALDEQLIAAAWKNDLRRARALVDQGADVNAKDNTVQSAYLISTSEGYLELLNLTLGHGADVDSKDSFNGTG